MCFGQDKYLIMREINTVPMFSFAGQNLHVHLGPDCRVIHKNPRKAQETWHPPLIHCNIHTHICYNPWALNFSQFPQTRVIYPLLHLATSSAISVILQ